MTSEHNAWPVIAKCMGQRNCRQKDLAAVLNISSSAVSQIKRGAFLLDSEQLRLIADFLKMSEEESSDFYLMLFRARLRGASAQSLPQSGKTQLVRIVGLSDMAFFEPVLVPLSEWLEQLSEQSITVELTGSGYVAVYLPDSRLGLAGETVLILKADCGVRDHNMALAQQQNGLLCLGYCSLKDDGIFIFDDLTGGTINCAYVELSRRFKWILPVCKAIWPASTLIRKKI